MMINHKAVYELEEWEQNVFAKQRSVDKAKKELEEAENKYREKVASFAGVETDKVRVLKDHSVGCMAKKICYHAYIVKDVYNIRSPENKCIYCGCDDFD